MLAEVLGRGGIEFQGAEMRLSVEGVYREGRIELCEVPADVPEETQVIVTFLGSGDVDLRARGIGEAQAAELRARLESFAEEWDSPEMDLYDHYDAVKRRL